MSKPVPADVPHDAVKEALRRVAASPVFAGAERMRRFLTLVVEEALAGKREQIKEYHLGVEVFDRGPDFDPRIDTIVRVEARRLRRKLYQYYSGAGAADPILISVPHGRYVPVFGFREVVAAALTTSRGADPPAALSSIAVLPLLDLSPGGDHAYLGDGFSEELINALASIPALKVAARTSAFRFRSPSDDARGIGAKLGVDHLLEGSIRLSGDRLRVTIQIVRAADGFHVWSREFDRPFTEALSLQREIARLAAASIGVALGNDTGGPGRCSPHAYRTYLEGRHHWRQFAPTATARAVACFETAIGLDGSFAPAHAGVAAALMQMSVWGMGSPIDLAARGRTAAERALAIDTHSVEAATQLGVIAAFHDWDWAAGPISRGISIRAPIDSSIRRGPERWRSCTQLWRGCARARAMRSRSRQASPASAIWIDASIGSSVRQTVASRSSCGWTFSRLGRACARRLAIATFVVGCDCPEARAASPEPLSASEPEIGAPVRRHTAAAIPDPGPERLRVERQHPRHRATRGPASDAPLRGRSHRRRLGAERRPCPPRTAFDILARVNGLEWTREGHTLRVFPRRR
jgi:TolB-like protein